jgi:hypothetical protein
MIGNQVKAPAPQGLQLFFAMYVVGLVFGIEQISDALFKHIKASNHSHNLPTYVAVALFISVIFLIIRFFWSTGNLRRAWQRAPDQKAAAPFFLVLQLPALLIQGVLVLFLFFSFSDRVTINMGSNSVIVWFTAATGWNAIWLLSLRGHRLAPEAIWIQNNLALVLFGAFLLAALHFTWIDDLYVLIAFIAAALASSIFDLCKTSDFYLSDIGQ